MRHRSLSLALALGVSAPFGCGDTQRHEQVVQAGGRAAIVSGPASASGAGGTAPASNGGAAPHTGGNAAVAGRGAAEAGGQGAAGDAATNAGGLGQGGQPTAPVAGAQAVGGSGAVDQPLADVTVHAGSIDRDHTIASFSFPAGSGQVLALRDAAGNEVPVQVDADGEATFVVTSLASGEQAQYTLVHPTRTPVDGATANVVAGAVQVDVGGSRVLELVTMTRLPSGVDGSNSRRGYIYPVFTPGGVLVADDYPPDDEIESMHLHHHGTWSAWTRTQFNGRAVDFWNPWGEGRVDLENVEAPWQGPVHAGLVATLTHEDVGAGGITALSERWVVRVYSTHAGAPPYFVFDLESTQQAVVAPLHLETYHYGGFAARGAREWRGGNFELITSAGDTAQPDENVAPRADWVHIGGQVGERVAGFALLGHPSNFCAPQGLRLHPSDPYVAVLPVPENVCGGFDIVPGTPYVSRFRFVVSDGSANPDLLDRMWTDYAMPPEVTVTRR